MIKVTRIDPFQKKKVKKMQTVAEVISRAAALEMSLPEPRSKIEAVLGCAKVNGEMIIRFEVLRINAETGQ